METIVQNLGIWALWVYILPGAVFILVAKYLTSTPVRAMVQLPQSVKDYVLALAVLAVVLASGMLFYASWGLLAKPFNVDSDQRRQESLKVLKEAVKSVEELRISKFPTTKARRIPHTNFEVDVKDPFKFEIRERRRNISEVAQAKVYGAYAVSLIRELDAKSTPLIVQSRAEEGFVGSMAALSTFCFLGCLALAIAKNWKGTLPFSSGAYIVFAVISLGSLALCRETAIVKGAWADHQTAGTILAIHGKIEST